MNEKRNQLIEQLSNELAPVRPTGSTVQPTGLWLASGFVFCVVAILLAAPFRNDWLLQLLQTPMFFLEMLLGMMAIGSLTALVFVSAIPAHPWRGSLLKIAFGITAMWIALQVYGLIHPALPQTSSHRSHCSLEVMLYSIPPLLLGNWMLSRLLPLDGWQSGAMLGLCAGLIPAWLMQVACIYDPAHGLLHHIAPVVVPVIAGALLLWWQRRRHRVSGSEKMIGHY